jgi:hypothetical protein
LDLTVSVRGRGGAEGAAEQFGFGRLFLFGFGCGGGRGFGCRGG